jgi:hypothetical protein
MARICNNAMQSKARFHVSISPGRSTKAQLLEVEFNDGRVMAYSGVSPEVHRSFMNAPSPVSFFEDRIVDDFPARRV